MDPEVQIQRREAQSYAAIPMQVTMDTLAGAVDQAFPELFGWLARHAIAPAGPPFIRYLVIDMAAGLQIEMGVPVAAAIDGDGSDGASGDGNSGDGGRITPGVLPAGRYAVLRHTGPYDGLIAGNAALQRWAEEHGITLDSWDTPEGTAWRARAEHYLTNPATEPDPAKWEVDVAYLVTES
jgi:effector-binding domain-containing protein